MLIHKNMAEDIYLALLSILSIFKNLKHLEAQIEIGEYMPSTDQHLESYHIIYIACSFGGMLKRGMSLICVECIGTLANNTYVNVSTCIHMGLFILLVIYLCTYICLYVLHK
jgi:hypothetical protein